MKTFISAILLSFALIAEISAQIGSSGTATVSGQVTDKSTSNPMEAATISITNRKTGQVITGGITNSKGEFRIQNIPFGIYNIGISFIGYQEVKLDSVAVDDNAVTLGTIPLSSSEVSLNEVTVVSEKPVIENRSDKIVYNVADDITSQGTQAIDVLRKVPQVTVDAEGNVELQGNSNIRFLINGKESSIFGNNIADALSSIPASQIKSIEAITNPGAKYDLQGTGGVINIILQENKLRGVSGNVNLSAGTRNQNGSLNLGIKKGNFGVNGYFSGNWRLGSDGSYSSVRQSTDTVTGRYSSLFQDGLNRFERNGYRAGTGFDWDISDKLNFSGTIGYNNFSFDNSGLVSIHDTVTGYTGDLISGSSTFRNFTNTRKTSSIDWNLDLKKKFSKEGHELDFVINSSYGRPDTRYLLTLSSFADSNPLKASESTNPGKDNTTTVSTDYVYPISSTSSFEAGVKGTFNHITSNAEVNVLNPLSGDYIFDPLQSYDLGYNLNIYAGYISAGYRLFNWLDVKSGARYEYSDVSVDFPGASVPSYGTIVPSLFFSHNFRERNALQLSYSRRIRRPDYRDLNPFINRSDPYNIETGNILLKPEINDRIELSYNTGLNKGGNLRITLSQQFSSREIENLTNFYPEYQIGDSLYRNVSVTTRQNIGSEYNTGINVFGSVPVTSNLSLRGNIMLFNTYIKGNPEIGNMSTGFRFRGNLNATWQLPQNLMVEFFGFWRSGGREVQGKEPQFYIYNFALRKLFWNKNASIGLTVTNAFRKDIRQVRTISTENSTLRTVTELPFRSFGISFTYKFGKMQQRQRQDRENNNNDEEQFGTPGG